MTPDYDGALAYLLGFTDWRRPVVHRPDAALNLPRMRALLDLLDAPDARFPAVVIAGTKGKGSTAAILAAIGRAAGCASGCTASRTCTTTASGCGSMARRSAARPSSR